MTEVTEPTPTPFVNPFPAFDAENVAKTLERLDIMPVNKPTLEAQWSRFNIYRLVKRLNGELKDQDLAAVAHILVDSISDHYESLSNSQDYEKYKDKLAEPLYNKNPLVKDAVNLIRERSTVQERGEPKEPIDKEAVMRIPKANWPASPKSVTPKDECKASEDDEKQIKIVGDVVSIILKDICGMSIPESAQKEFLSKAKDFVAENPHVLHDLCKSEGVEEIVAAYIFFKKYVQFFHVVPIAPLVCSQFEGTDAVIAETILCAKLYYFFRHTNLVNLVGKIVDTQPVWNKCLA